ncbi:hypothetical protein HOLleu_32024 [Holothuria leucospilota]|uniref:HAT C-terminal dimerisation domain-containing protein n=1 Tax=Holothuria leucospilota TaxID=206669 RepID=A0A9Q0YTJ3_HOLLE|nr:hypothetical protein HOLleu_32024 [Holothuria leucospilota]
MAKFYLGMKASLPVLTMMESFNRSLQAKDQTVECMIQCAKILRDQLTQMRNEEDFSVLFTRVSGFIEKIDEMEGFCQPRRRKVSGKLGSGFVAPEQTVEEQFRSQYFAAIDSAIVNLDTYFSTTDIHKYEQIVNMLITGKVNVAVVQSYPELSDGLELELQFFHRQYLSQCKPSLEQVHTIMRDMSHQVRQMFPWVEPLLRLILVSPASSCTAERIFQCPSKNQNMASKHNGTDVLK